MDGSPVVNNYAGLDEGSQLDTTIAMGVTFVEADGDNLVCSVDMYFNYDEKACTSFPYTSDIPLVYRVINSIQHGHQMIV